MDTLDKLGILAEAARFDAACTSSGPDRAPKAGALGATTPSGICHSFTQDGRCITLLKVLMSNACSYDCAYCVNRRSASVPRATFSPRELAELTVDFYKRNYIEGLFLSSGVLGTPDATCERMIECLRILRDDLQFRGYVHAKVIPGTSADLIDAVGRLADRLSVNLELPSSHSLQLLCPDKDAKGVLAPMGQIKRERDGEEQRLLEESPRGSRRLRARAAIADKPLGPGADLAMDSLAVGDLAATAPPSATLRQASSPRGAAPLFSNAAKLTATQHSRVATSRRTFAPAGQSTQLIVGASDEDDNHILQLSQSLYRKFDLKRVFFSAYMPELDDPRLPEPGTPVPLRREHRLYQADWLMRYYAFSPDELVTPQEPWLDLDVDPKLAWALRHMDLFPVEVMDAPLDVLVRVPGIGVVGARRITYARRTKRLAFDDLRALHITLKRARHFITCSGQRDPQCPLDPELIRERVIQDAQASSYAKARREREGGQLRLF